MPASAEYIIAGYVCPTLGAIIATFTFLAPVNSLKKSIKCGSLGLLNPTPWAFMTGNTIGWVAYSFITLDLFVLFANVPGLVISVWLNVGAMKVQYYEEIVKYSSIQVVERGEDEDEDEDEVDANEKKWGNDADSGDINEDESNGSRDLAVLSPNEEQPVCQAFSNVTSHELLVIQVLITWVALLSIVSFVPMTKKDKQIIVGVSVNIFLVFFYAAPLSTIVAVIRTKSSASIHFRTMVMNTTNCVFWCLYAVAIQDPFILLPNGLGLLFGVIQIVLYMIYPINDRGLSGDEIVAEFLDDAEHPRSNSSGLV